MAAGTKLVLEFENSSGNSIIMSYNYANPSVTVTAVKNLMNKIIENGDIFENVPVTIKGAKTVNTTENVFDLSD